MNAAIATYTYMRTQQGLPAVDACADAAQFHGVKPAALALAILERGDCHEYDRSRLELMTS